MPKLIELTVELEIQRVSCPGVWLCQDGRVSLTVFALGTSYQTCLLPPIFPLLYKDVFYFRKRYQATCALNNICCLMKDETVYCELVQWYDDSGAGDSVILAQYLGSLNDVLFPPNLCSNDGVDLLMRRTKEFPGILSPKIEVATKVRIDEVRNSRHYETPKTTTTCECGKGPTSARQKPVCHSAPYHRRKCSSSQHKHHPRSQSRSTSRTRSNASKSCYSFQKEADVNCDCPKSNYEDEQYQERYLPNDNLLQKRIVESRYIDEGDSRPRERSHILVPKVAPCVCEICQRYHELFHS